MDHVLADYGLRLTYLQPPYSIDNVDQDRIFADLAEAASVEQTVPSTVQFGLFDHDHLVLATDRNSGQYLGIVGANDGSTAKEHFLMVETAFAVPTVRGHNLIRRLVALAMLRISGLGTTPSIIAACAYDDVLYRVLYDMAHRCAKAAIFPEPNSNVIKFRTTTLAQRITRAVYPQSRLQVTSGLIGRENAMATLRYAQLGSSVPQSESTVSGHARTAGRMLTVLDLREMDEKTLLDDARRLYRSK